MTLWQNQEVVITTAKGTQLFQGTIEKAGSWSDIVFKLPPNVETISVTLSQVHSLASRRKGTDQRRLGLAIKAPMFEVLPSPDPGNPAANVISAYPESIRAAVIDTLTQELDAPVTTPEQVTQPTPESPNTPGNIYTLLQDLDSEAEQTEPSQELNNTSAAEVLNIPAADNMASMAQQQEEFRKKFLDTILAATAEGG